MTFCRVCHTNPTRPGRRDQRCAICAAYWYRYHRDRTETLVLRNNRRHLDDQLAARWHHR